MRVGVSNDNVVWIANDGNDDEIFLYNGEVTQITDNEQFDSLASISGNNLVWYRSFDRAIAQKTNFHQAYYGKGLALYDLGRNRKANKAFKQAIDLEANFYPAWYRRSLTLLNLKKYPQALKAIDKAISLQPNNTAIYALKGDALQNMSQYEAAIDAYSKAIAQDNNPLILNSRSSIYRILNKPELALQDLNQAIKFDLRYTEGYINRGMTYYQLENYEQALINLNHVTHLPMLLII